MHFAMNEIAWSALAVGAVSLAFFLWRRRNTASHIPTWQELALPHSELVEIRANGANARLWTVTGQYRPDRNMTIFKLKDGGLWIHSAIVLEEKVQKQLETLGTPKWLVVPNTQHTRDAAAYKKRYPSITVLCPSFCLKQVEQKVKVDAVVEDTNIEDVTALRIPKQTAELVYDLQMSEGSSALVFCDLMFNININEHKGIGWVILKILGSGGDGVNPKVTPLSKKFLNIPEAKKWFLQVSQRTDISAITVAHGNFVTENCAAKLKNVANAL